MTKAIPYKRYDTTLENLTSTLDQYGVATLPNILTREECLRLRQAMWDELNHVTKGRFNIDDESTWNAYYELAPRHSMLAQHWSLGHTQPVWDVRQHERVGQVFSTLWETPVEDMLVSFDGLSIALPPEVTGQGWYEGMDWLHTDQSPQKEGRHCIQALINLFDVNEGDATLSILEGSHNHHKPFFQSAGYNGPSDWYKLRNEQEIEYFTQRGCQQYNVQADIGSMVLFDSRTIHEGIQPQRTRVAKRTKPNTRMVFYVCMLPRSSATEETLKKKQQAFKDLRLTNHWANQAKLFSLKPVLESKGQPLPDLNPIHPPQLTELGYRLAGF